MPSTRFSLLRKRPFSFFFLAIALLTLASFVAACGTNAGSGTTTGAGAGSTPTATPTTTTVKGYGAAQGCPSDEVVSTAPPAANVVVKPSQAKAPISASVGNVIEIDLPFGHKWTGPSTTGNLTLQQPAGYAWKDGNACVWRFTAQSAGTTTLAFTEQALCKKGELCPMYIAVVNFQVTIK